MLFLILKQYTALFTNGIVLHFDEFSIVGHKNHVIRGLPVLTRFGWVLTLSKMGKSLVE